MSGKSLARNVAASVLERGLPPGTLLNVNVPAVEPEALRGLEITRIGQRTYDEQFIKREDPYGTPYYWLGGALPVDIPDDGTDVGAVANDLVSITPISLDLTDYAFLDELRRWQIDLPVSSLAQTTSSAYGLQTDAG